MKSRRTGARDQRGGRSVQFARRSRRGRWPCGGRPASGRLTPPPPAPLPPPPPPALAHPLPFPPSPPDPPSPRCLMSSSLLACPPLCSLSRRTPSSSAACLPTTPLSTPAPSFFRILVLIPILTTPSCRHLIVFYPLDVVGRHRDLPTGICRWKRWKWLGT